MTFKSFLGLGLVFSLLTSLGKLVTLFYLDPTTGLTQTFFLVYMLLMSAAVVRRVGVMNFFESFLLIAVWTFFGIVGDIFITATIAGLVVYTTFIFWAGYIVAAVSMLLFHKKLHIHTRHEAAKHGGHH